MSRFAVSDHYTVLGVCRDADRAAIRSAYRSLARVHHPDAGGDERLMMRINEAWRVLGRDETRLAYDAACAASLQRRASATRPVSAAASTAMRATPASQASAQPAARTQAADDGPVVLDFGRFRGWTIEDVAAADDDYLDWLARTPAGRPFSAAIRRVLDERQRAYDALRPAVKPQRRGWGFR